MKKFSDHFSQLVPHKEFDPKAFVEDKKVSQDLCNFVLALSLAYNDFRFYNMIFIMSVESKPEGDSKKSSEWGEYHGIRLHIIRLHIGFVHELFKLIQENKSVLEDSFLQDIVRCLNPAARKAWSALVEAALADEAAPRRSNPLYMLRNKLVYHYKPKELFSGYKGGFFKEGKITENACISLGNNLATSRFYFTDKAIAGYIEKELGTDPETFFQSLGKTAADINFALFNMCTLFIQKRGFSWKEAQK